MKRHHRRLAALAVLLAAGVAGACETVKGAGRDIESAAGATERALSGEKDQPKSEPKND